MRRYALYRVPLLVRYVCIVISRESVNQLPREGSRLNLFNHVIRFIRS